MRLIASNVLIPSPSTVIGEGLGVPEVSHGAHMADRARRFKPRPARFRPTRRFKPRPARFKPARRFKPRPARFKTPGGPTQLFAVSFPGPNRHGFAPSHDNLTSQVGECRVELDSPQLQSMAPVKKNDRSSRWMTFASRPCWEP